MGVATSPGAPTDEGVVKKGKKLKDTWCRELEHAGGVYAIAWSPDGKVLASGGGDNKVVLRDAVLPRTSVVPFWADAAPEHIVNALSASKHIRDTLLFGQRPSDGCGLLSALVQRGESECIHALLSYIEQDNGIAALASPLLFGTLDDSGQSALDHAITAAQPDVIRHLLKVTMMPAFRFSRAKLHDFLVSACQDFTRSYARVTAALPIDDYPAALATAPSLERAPSRVLKLNKGSMAMAAHAHSWFATQETLWGSLQADTQRWTGPEVDVRCGLIGLPGLVDMPSTKKRPSLFHAYVKAADFQLIMSEAFQAAVVYKWDAYGRRIWLKNLFIYVLTWVSYETGCSLLLPLLQQAASASSAVEGSGNVWEDPESASRAAIALGLVGVASLLALAQLKGEYAELVQSGSPLEYFSSLWNLADLLFVFVIPCTCTLLATCTVPGAQLLHNALAEQPKATALLRAAQISTSTGTLICLLRGKKAVRGLAKTSALLSLLQESVIDMASFLGIFLIVVVAQGLALWHLQLISELTPTAMLDSFRFAIGSPNDDVYPSDPISEFWLLYVLWSLFLIIVMLNSLIAILGDTYDRVMEFQDPRGLLERARLLLELEQQMSPRERNNNKYFPPFVHVIKRVEEEEEDGDTLQWNGRMAAIKAQAKTLKEGQDKLKEGQDHLKEGQDKLKAELLSELKKLQR